MSSPAHFFECMGGLPLTHHTAAAPQHSSARLLRGAHDWPLFKLYHRGDAQVGRRLPLS